MNIPLKENERLDDLQNGYHIIQNTRDFCYGIDAVLLSDFARVKKGEQALDLGTGTGNEGDFADLSWNGRVYCAI